MAYQYVAAAIDHGTTNSSIAVMDSDTPRVIKPNGVDEVMPSAVYIDKRGRRLVGQPALQAMLINPHEEGNGYTGYKLRIGQDDRYEFAAAGKVVTAPELGAVVMGRLLEAYREEMEQELKACVITVPAKFEQSACDGTREAARLAGLLYYPLLQEPIAAALAYGFAATDERAHWMVFDLGGGTLDVSLVIVRQGQMVVPQEGHAGDNRLGGRKFDRELFDYVRQELAKTYALDEFAENHPAYSTAWGRLMLAVERAKIALSRREEAVVDIDGVLCTDAKGKEVRVEVPITRTLYEKLITPDVEKAVHVCNTLLRMNRLAASDIDRLILIGGPTKTPYIQRLLTERLNIALETSLDPMTAVAQGAALYATTVEIPQGVRTNLSVPEPAPGLFTLTLKYDRKSHLPTHNVLGKVEGHRDSQEALMVEIRRADGLWASGRHPVDASGMFSVDVMLLDQSQPRLSRFTTTVFDGTGHAATAVDEPAIWYPFPDGKPRLANSLLVALRGNQTDMLIKQGADLPARSPRKTYYAAKAIRQGSSEDILRIPILEAVTHLLGGEDAHADCNVHVGTLVIEGSNQQLTRDLPQGAEIDLTIYQDESREIRAVAYVPLLAEEFEAQFEPEAFQETFAAVNERFEGLSTALRQNEELQRKKPLPEIAEAMETMHRLSVVDSITTDITRAREGERDALYRAYRRMLELAGALNQMRRRQTSMRILDVLEQLQDIVQDADSQDLAHIRQDYEAADGANDESELEQIEARLDSLNRRVRLLPVWDLYLDVNAFPKNFRGTPEQLVAFTEAETLLFKEILPVMNRGGEASPRRLEEAMHAHARLLRTWPELPHWRQKKQEEWAAERKHMGNLDISDIEQAGPRTV